MILLLDDTRNSLYYGNDQVYIYLQEYIHTIIHVPRIGHIASNSRPLDPESPDDDDSNGRRSDGGPGWHRLRLPISSCQLPSAVPLQAPLGSARWKNDIVARRVGD